MWSRCSAGSAVALCGGRGGHRLLSCAAAPARRRAPGASASAKGIPRSALRASVTPEFVTAAPDEAVEESSVEREPAAENKLRKLACPICYYPLISSSDQSAPVSAASSSSLECSTCKKFYPSRGDYWDMTVAVGSTEYSESTTVTTEVFRTLALVRADISRLPFVSGSIDAVHAAAAIHCWPSPACAVAEISRVLRPGGVFVASTFVADILPPAVPVLRIGRPILAYLS
uniref:Methyltransferase type 11 domain-containing protein n=1 Tax=Oryza glumipatula TaxID=40148 RepID=A0A0E0AV92_9ORYZ